jgi:hypothetical protein
MGAITSDSSNQCWRLGSDGQTNRYTGTDATMHSSSEIHDDAVTLTWCACELCNSVGPRFMTLVRNHREYTVELSPHCCNPGIEYERVGGETQYYDVRPSLRQQIRR